MTENRVKEMSLRRVIRRLVRAELDESWAGTYPISEREPIKLELKRAKEAVTRAIERVLS
jgi:hypothetical protein